MSVKMTDVVVHVDETLDKGSLQDLEHWIRQHDGVISVGHHPDRPHLVTVLYDPERTQASNVLHHVQGRGLHAQLVGA